jgi:hypothetical protein
MTDKSSISQWFVLIHSFPTKGIPVMNEQYTCVSNHEIQRLTELKAPPSVWSVYLALCSFDYGFKKGHCWPSISALYEKLGGQLTKRRIYSALAWMVENSIIRREKARIGGKINQKRFQLILRKTFRLIQKVLAPSPSKAGLDNLQRKSCASFQSSRDDGKRTKRKKETKNNFFIRKNLLRDKRKAISKEESARRKSQSEREPGIGELLFSRVLIGAEEMTVEIMKKIRDDISKNHSFKDWLQDYHPEYADMILKTQYY